MAEQNPTATQSRSPIKAVDLIFVSEPLRRTMSAGVIFQDGTDRQIGPFPSTGAFGPIGDELAALDPDQFGDVEQTRWQLTAMHFRNMTRRQNDAGQDYPVKIGSGQ
jgi:hypothetical protein